MTDERLRDFPTKTTCVPADIVYVGDSAAADNEVRVDVSGLIGAYPALLSIGELVTVANEMIYTTNVDTYATTPVTAYGIAFLNQANAAAARTALGLVIGTNVEAWSAALDSIAGLTTAAYDFIYTTASNTYATLATSASAVLVTSAGSVPSFSQTLPTAVQANITQVGTQTAAINMNSHKITNLTDPTSAQDAATKAYTDSISAGLNPIPGVSAATTVALTATYSNGTSGVGATLTNAGAMAAFAVDGYSASLNDRILIKNQASTFQNGVYVVSTLGSGAANWVLTRATDYNTPGAINVGDLVAVANGTTNIGSSWLETATVTTIGTDPIVFSVFFSPASYLKSANNLSDVANAATSRTNLGAAASGANGDITSMTGLTGYLKAPLGVKDTNGNVVVAYANVASAVNYVSLTNSATAGNPVVSALGSDSNITLQVSGKGTGAVAVRGTGTNDSAAAGYVGELLTVAFSGVSCPTGTNTNLGSINLTAGDWDLWSIAVFVGSGAGVWSSNFIGFSTTSVTFSATGTYLSDNIAAGFGASATQGYAIPVLPAQLTGTTTYYLVAQTNHTTGTVSATGTIYGRRVR